MREEASRLRRSLSSDFSIIHSIIEGAAQVYKGMIPEDCWKEPYMSEAELQEEIDAGVMFWVYQRDSHLLGVMGLQLVRDVALIRHSYVRPGCQGQGIGNELLGHLKALTGRPILVGTWADAGWAIRFYERNGFKLVASTVKDRLLRRYWSISDRQIATSVVLADRPWFSHAASEEINDPIPGE